MEASRHEDNPLYHCLFITYFVVSLSTGKNLSSEQHDARSSAMYAAGLLLQDGGTGEDVRSATSIIDLIAKAQHVLEMQSVVH